jgi:hypothetical protein
MDFILGIALLAAVGYVAFHIGKEVGYEEAVSSRRLRQCRG